MSLRVLCLTDNFNRPETETFIGLMKAGVDIKVLVRPEPPYPPAEQAGLPTEDFFVRGRFDIKAILGLRKRLKEGNYDILHVFNNRAASVGVLAAVGLPVKIIAYRGIVGNVSFFSLNSWLTYLNPRVSRVVCVAEAIRRHFLGMRLLGYRLSEEKLVTIYKGHELSWYQAPAADLAQFGVPGGAFVVCFTGRDRPRKGIELLIEALELLPEDVNAHLLLVGKMHRRKLLDKIANSPRRERIHLAGYRTDAPQIAAACSAFALPSLDREGLPRAVIEAMAYGTPPIVSDAGGNPELVEHGKSGLVTRSGAVRDLATAIESLYRHQDKRMALGKAAQERIATVFNNRETVRRTLDLYLEVKEKVVAVRDSLVS